MPKRAVPLTILFTIALLTELHAAWNLEIFLGTAKSFDSNLTIRDSAASELKFKAQYETKPFEDAPYYAWRLSHRGKIHGWAVELVHHKIYLKNTSPAVSHFEISHGYNLLMFDYLRALGSFQLNLGGGAVIAYPHGTIDQEETLGGYQLAGPAAQAAIERQFHLNDRLFLVLEGKFTIARASIGLGSHHAVAPNFALHGLAGLGIRLY